MKLLVIVLFLMIYSCENRGLFKDTFESSFNEKLSQRTSSTGRSQKIYLNKRWYTLPGLFDLHKYVSVGDSITKKNNSFKITVHKIRNDIVIETRTFDNEYMYQFYQSE